MAVEYERHALAVAGGEELDEAVDEFRPVGEVLELACGTGVWTAQLARYATELTALDASSEMLAVAKRRVGEQVRFVHADVFDWAPERRYDVVFFGFWLSHLGWNIEVHQTAGPFFWGAGGFAPSKRKPRLPE